MWRNSYSAVILLSCCRLSLLGCPLPQCPPISCNFRLVSLLSSNPGCLFCSLMRGVSVDCTCLSIMLSLHRFGIFLCWRLPKCEWVRYRTRWGEFLGWRALFAGWPMFVESLLPKRLVTNLIVWIVGIYQGNGGFILIFWWSYGFATSYYSKDRA